MKTALIFVATLDGKTTKGNMPFVHQWSSKEDHEYFIKTWDESRLTVLGSATYDADPIKPSPSHHLIIMTRRPEKYKADEVVGRLEFTNESPAQLVARYQNEGLRQMLVAGGSQVATSFLKAKLIDELWLTIEPKIFGTGRNLVVPEDMDIELQLISMERANERGTLITKYAVMK